MTHSGWIAVATVLGLVVALGLAGALVVWWRARVRGAIQELDHFALLTEARWEGNALLCRVVGGAQLRLDVASLRAIDWREYGDRAQDRDRVVAFTFRFAGTVPPVGVMGARSSATKDSDGPISTIQKGLTERSLIRGKPKTHYGALSLVTNEARRRVSTVRRAY